MPLTEWRKTEARRRRHPEGTPVDAVDAARASPDHGWWYSEDDASVWFGTVRVRGGVPERCVIGRGGRTVAAGAARAGGRREGSGEDGASAQGAEGAAVFGDGPVEVGSADEVGAAIGGAGERDRRVAVRPGRTRRDAAAKEADHDVTPSRTGAARTGRRGPVSGLWCHITADTYPSTVDAHRLSISVRVETLSGLGMLGSANSLYLTRRI